jgi:hypothetical protein
MANTTQPRPSIKKAGPARQYVQVEINGENQRVMLDENVVDEWENIDTMTFGVVKQTKKTGTAEDVALGLITADKVGELFDHVWYRPEVIDYQTFGRQKAVKTHEIEMRLLTKRLMQETIIDTPEAALALAVD